MSKYGVVATALEVSAGLVAAKMAYEVVDTIVGTEGIINKVGAACLATGFFQMGFNFMTNTVDDILTAYDVTFKKSTEEATDGGN